MTPQLDSDLLRSFAAVADAGSISGGAERLARTQSAVSMQIKKLEDAAGQTLFKRGARGVQLTEAGEALLSRARHILALLGEAEAALSSDPLVGRVRIGVPEEYGAPILPVVLARFAETHPEVEVTVHCEPSEHLETLLDRGALDLAVLSIDSGRVTGETLAHDPTVWVTSTRHGADRGEPLPVAMYAQDCWWRGWALTALDARGRQYRVAYTSRSVAGIQAAVVAGLAVAVLAKSTMPAHSRMLGADEGYTELPGSAIVLRRAAGPGEQAAEGMAQALRDAFRDPSRG